MMHKSDDEGKQKLGPIRIEQNMHILLAKKDYKDLGQFLENWKDETIKISDKGELEPYSQELIQFERLKELVMYILERFQLNDINLNFVNDLLWVLTNLFASHTVDPLFQEQVLRVSHFYLEEDRLLASVLWLWANICENGCADTYLLENVLKSSLISRVRSFKGPSSKDARESLIRILGGIALVQERLRRPEKEVQKLCSLLGQDLFEIIKENEGDQCMVQNAIIYLNWCAEQQFPKPDNVSSILEIADKLETSGQRFWMLKLLGNLTSHDEPNLLGYVSLIIAFLRDCLLIDEETYAKLVAFCLGNLFCDSVGTNDIILLFDDGFFVGFLTRCLCQDSPAIQTEALIALNAVKYTKEAHKHALLMRELAHPLCKNEDQLVMSYAKRFVEKTSSL